MFALCLPLLLHEECYLTQYENVCIVSALAFTWGMLFDTIWKCLHCVCPCFYMKNVIWHDMKMFALCLPLLLHEECYLTWYENVCIVSALAFTWGMLFDMIWKCLHCVCPCFYMKNVIWHDMKMFALCLPLLLHEECYLTQYENVCIVSALAFTWRMLFDTIWKCLHCVCPCFYMKNVIWHNMKMFALCLPLLLHEECHFLTFVFKNTSSGLCSNCTDVHWNMLWDPFLEQF